MSGRGWRGAVAATVVLAIPVAALGGLGGLAISRTVDRTASLAAACASWADEYRRAQADRATAEQLWRDATRLGDYRPVERAEFRDRVAALAAERPPRCNPTGRLTS